MADSDYYAPTRPRIPQTAYDKLSTMKEKLAHMLENDENTEFIEKHYQGKQGKLSQGEIIDEALNVLEERGLIE